MLSSFSLAVRAVSLIALALAVSSSAGCGQNGLPRGAVQGRVTIGGQPLARGRVLFLPASGPTVTATVVNGEYQLPSHEGPIAGANRVEVEAELDLGFAIDDEAAFARLGGRPLPPSPIPPEFNLRSQLELAVEAGGEHTLDIAIPAAAQVSARGRY